MAEAACQVMDGNPLETARLPLASLTLSLPLGLQVVALELLSPELTLRALTGLLGQVLVALPRAVPKRRAEFAAGRYAASLALARYGCRELVPRGANGAPHWPQGFTGSISHGAGLAVAVAARSADFAGVGLDVEASISEQQCAEVAARILDADEFELLGQALCARPMTDHLSLGFSAKESLYKCLNPIVDQFIEFEGARVSRVQPNSANEGQIWLSLTRPLSAELAAGVELPGRYAFAHGRVETVVWLSSRSSS